MPSIGGYDLFSTYVMKSSTHYLRCTRRPTACVTISDGVLHDGSMSGLDLGTSMFAAKKAIPLITIPDHYMPPLLMVIFRVD